MAGSDTTSPGLAGSSLPPIDASPPMAAAPPQQPDHPSTSGSLGYFHLRLVGPSPALLLLRSDRLYSLSPSRCRGHGLRLLLARPRRPRARDLLLSTSGCALRLTHRFSGAGAPSVNGRPLRARVPAELAVGDEISVLWRGAGYGFVVERFVSCGGCRGGAAAGAGSCEVVFRAESLRKRLRAISESEDPLSFFRDLSCSGNGGVDAGVKELRQDGAGELCLDNPTNPISKDNLLQNDCNLDPDKLEHHPDVPKGGDADAELCQGSKVCGNDNAEQTGCSNRNEEQHHGEGCYSDGSTFFLNRLVGIGSVSGSRDEPSEVTLPQLLHPVESLVRVFIATFTLDISWFLGYCKIPQHLPVTVACHNKERCWSASSENRTTAPLESHPNLLLVYPRFPEEIAFGKDRKDQGVACHHPKLIVLQREDCMRVIVTSANLVPRQWHLITNTVWWQDFPRRTSLDYAALFSAAKKQKSDFAAQLASFVASMVNEVPSQAYWINEIAKYDFEGAGGYLIASVPGIHARTPPYLESNYFLSEKDILHTKSAHRMFAGSVQTSVVGLSHRFHMPSDAGSRLRALSELLGKCRENMHGTTEVILKRNTNIPSDANAVSVLVADLDKFSEEGSVHLGFLPREVAKWVAPLSDSGFFNFSGFIYPREALEAAYGVTDTKVQLFLSVSKGPEFSRISGLICDEHFPPLCSLIASLKRCVGLWRLEEVLSNIKWPETLETDFIYSASSIGTSINPQFIASFASATGKRTHQDFDSQESDPEWGCWTAKQELKKPSISLLFPTIDRVKRGACGIQLCRNLLSLPEKTWQRLRSTGIFHDAIPQPYARIGRPMHVKVAQRRFESRPEGHSFGWTYCGSHNFSPAAWGQLLSPPPKANATEARAAPSGPRLHICNYELGIILISPPPGMSKDASESRYRIDSIALPFVVPPPRYKGSDRPATRLAMREAVAEACVMQNNDVVNLSEDTDEDVPDEDDEQEVELSDCSQQEKEEEKIYAETLWGQVDSSQSQENDS